MTLKFEEDSMIQKWTWRNCKGVQWSLSFEVWSILKISEGWFTIKKYQVNTLSMILCILCYKNRIIGGLYLVSLCVKNLQPSFKIKNRKIQTNPLTSKTALFGLKSCQNRGFFVPDNKLEILSPEILLW